MSVGRRRDAQRNREEIVRAVTQILTHEREMVSHERVARLTGLSPSTVYRHFQDRHSLVEAITERQFEVFDGMVQAALQHPGGLRLLLRRLLERQRALYPLAGLLRRLPEQKRLSYVARIVRTLDPLIRQAEENRILRRPLSPATLNTVLTMFDAAVAMDKTEGTDVAGDAIELLLDGLVVESE